MRKWKGREAPADRSHRPHKLSTTLSEAQEAIVVELRRLLLLPLDDLLVITREFIHAGVSRSALNRCLVRHGVSNLHALRAELNPQEGAADKPVKTLKAYEPGFVHIDIKYLPQMPDERQRCYLFVAIDRATRWVHIGLYDDQSEASAVDFLARVHEAAPMTITKVLTDNGSQFTDRFTCKARVPSGRHHFDVHCKALGIEHRLCPPRHPQTSGMVERFNARVGEVIAQTDSAVRPNWQQRCWPTPKPTTTASLSVPWITSLPFRLSNSGTFVLPTCSSGRFMISRVLTRRSPIDSPPVPGSIGSPRPSSHRLNPQSVDESLHLPGEEGRGFF